MKDLRGILVASAAIACAATAATGAASDGAVEPAAANVGLQLGRLTPRPGPQPRINGPRVYGVRPGHPVIYRLPATGVEPLAYAVGPLPEGLSFDAAKGVLTGSLAMRGDYPVVFMATNAAGSARATVTFRVGDAIALTPPMGWNHWNCFATTVTAEKILEAADAMDRSELARHGYSYVNIDDFWQNSPAEAEDETLMGPARDSDGAMLANRRFPSMKAVADAIHARGFRAGIYSSPGPLTCGKCTGSWQHEWTDAQTFAAWGYDYLKYDWCSYSTLSEKYGEGDLARMTLPFLLMGEALRAQNRDIVFSLCQYGMHNVSTWGARVGGQTWRTTHDITDTWRRTGDISKRPLCWFRGIKEIIDLQVALWPYAGPGAWNDADMLEVGVVGGLSPRPTGLTPNEQYTHMSFWCILCSPLLVGCDLTKLDDFTLGLLCNDEVLETNQDPLGAQAARVAVRDDGEVWAKPMSDGSIVFALLNTAAETCAQSVDFAALGLRGEWRVRDLWRQSDVGRRMHGIAAEVPSHATYLYRCWPTEGAGLSEGLADIRMNWVYSTYGRVHPKVTAGIPSSDPPRRDARRAARP